MPSSRPSIAAAPRVQSPLRTGLPTAPKPPPDPAMGRVWLSPPSCFRPRASICVCGPGGSRWRPQGRVVRSKVERRVLTHPDACREPGAIPAPTAPPSLAIRQALPGSRGRRRGPRQSPSAVAARRSAGRQARNMESVFGGDPIGPSEMTKKLWAYVKRKRIGRKGDQADPRV